MSDSKTVATKTSDDIPQNTPMWKGPDGEMRPISSLEDRQIKEAIVHCFYKLGEHSKRIVEATQSINLFEQKLEELQAEAEERDEDVVDIEVEQLEEFIEVANNLRKKL